MATRTFIPEKYRSDATGLDYCVIAYDACEVRVMAQELSRQTAEELAEAFNAIERRLAARYYN